MGLALTSSITLSLNAFILFAIALSLGVRIDLRSFSKNIFLLLLALGHVSANILFKSIELNFFSGKIQNIFELSISVLMFIFIIGGTSYSFP